MSSPVTNKEAAIASLLERGSVSPKRLGAPGPDAQEMNLILQAALRTPDHGGLERRALLRLGTHGATRHPAGGIAGRLRQPGPGDRGAPFEAACVSRGSLVTVATHRERADARR